MKRCSHAEALQINAGNALNKKLLLKLLIGECSLDGQATLLPQSLVLQGSNPKQMRSIFGFL